MNPPNAQKSLLPNSVLQPEINAHHWLVQAKQSTNPTKGLWQRDGEFTALRDPAGLYLTKLSNALKGQGERGLAEGRMDAAQEGVPCLAADCQ